MDIFNKKKLQDLQNKLNKTQQEYNKTLYKLKEVTNMNLKYKKLIEPEHYTLPELKIEVSDLTQEKKSIINKINIAKLELSLYDGELCYKSIHLSDLNQNCLYSHELKEKIIDNKNEQKQMIRKNLGILFSSESLAIDGNTNQGQILKNNMSKIAIGTFNLYCDNIISSLTISNIEKSHNKICNNAQKINNYINILDLKINQNYVELKIKELYLQYQYLNMRKDEQAKLEHEKEILRDQAKADKELSKLQEKQEHELNDLKYKYNIAIAKNKELALIHELKAKIDELESRTNITRRSLRDQKCGYLYIVGCRDMIKGQLKIGVTKRDIETRMRELANASHSFPMEVYSYVFVDDCYAIETKMHQYFDNKRVNVNNKQKEWFYVTFDEVKQALKEQCDINIELNEHPCQDYIDSKNKFDFL